LRVCSRDGPSLSPATHPPGSRKVDGPFAYTCVATEIVFVAVWPFAAFAVSRYVWVWPLQGTVIDVFPFGP
jgi:hypothetical protein